MIEAVSCDVLVIGAGVTGLAVAAQLDSRLTAIIVEAYPKFGQETSSRNSEVVHSGIYYPPHSAKTRLCIEGRKLLYEYCAVRAVPHAKVGKILVSTQPEEDVYLEKMANHCQSLAVPFKFISRAEIHRREPLIQANQGLFFRESGIVDSHQLMAALERQFLEAGGLIAYRHRVKEIERTENFWKVVVQRPEGEIVIEANIVVNAGGLAAAELSNLAIGTDRYEHRYCRGRYFTLAQSYQNRFAHLVYPCPPKDGLGVHITIDIDRFARLGPDVDWCPGITYANASRLYDCDWDSLREPFLSAVQRYCPTVRAHDISPGLIGIRSKLFVDGSAHPDFLIERIDNWVHCLGIESPGLTSSLAIAKEVSKLLND